MAHSRQETEGNVSMAEKLLGIKSGVGGPSGGNSVSLSESIWLDLGEPIQAMSGSYGRELKNTRYKWIQKKSWIYHGGV